MDYKKRTQKEIEEMGHRGGRDEKLIKKAGFDYRMQRVEEALKKTTTEERAKELQKVRDYTLRAYNKYNNSNFKS